MRLALLVLATAVLLGACGGQSERPAQHRDVPPPTVADDNGPGEIGGSHGEATSGIGAVDRYVLSLVLEPATLTAGQSGEIAFRVLGPDGEPRTHTKGAQLILVSKDLRYFHHLHPEVDGTTWRARVRPEAPGDYMVILDANNQGRRQAVTGDLRVGGAERAVPQPRDAGVHFQEQRLVANRRLTLKFAAPGATDGHLVIIREGTLEYVHVDPHEDEFAFEATFPQPGAYVMFLEYERGDKVGWSRFAVIVS